MIKKINRKINNPFVYPIVILLIFSFILVYTPVFASSQSKDLILVKKYCKRNYPTNTVKIVSKYNPKIMENRKGKELYMWKSLYHIQKENMVTVKKANM